MARLRSLFCTPLARSPASASTARTVLVRTLCRSFSFLGRVRAKRLLNLLRMLKLLRTLLLRRPLMNSDASNSSSSASPVAASAPQFFAKRCKPPWNRAPESTARKPPCPPVQHPSATPTTAPPTLPPPPLPPPSHPPY